MKSKVSTKVLLKELRKAVSPYSLLFAAGFMCACLTVVFELGVPMVSRHIIDQYVVKRSYIFEYSPADIVPDDAVILDDKTFFLDLNRITYQSRKLQEMAKDATLYYVTAVTDLNIKLVEQYDAIKKYDQYLTLPADALSTLSITDLQRLRKADLRNVYLFGLIAIALVALNFLFTYIALLIVTYAGQKVIHHIRIRLYRHIVDLPMRFFDTEQSGKIVTRVTNDISNIEEFFTSVFVNIFKDIFILAGILGVLLFIDRRLGLVACALMPVVICVTLLFRRLMHKAFHNVREALSRVNTRLTESLNGVGVIQIFSKEKKYYDRFVEVNHNYYKASTGQVFINALYNPAISLIRFTGIGIIIYVGSQNVLSGLLSLGTLVLFISYLEKFFQPIQDIAEKINIIQSAQASAERVFALHLETAEADISDSNLTVAEVMGKGADSFIRFKDVTFSYDEKHTVLKNFSLSIKHGESIALVGPTGCGKTTILNLLSRLYIQQDGTISVNGIDIREIPKQELRSLVGVVQQDVTLFADTIENNITLGKKSAEDDFEKVCAYTNCHSFIDKLSSGKETVLSEDGMSLSFGERQLISFARVLSYDPEIFVFDEATSNIDTETEMLIQDALDNILQDRTSIIVAHRLSTIKHCDKIIVLDQGEIVEEGSHDELIALRGTYYKLYLLQYKEHIKDNEIDEAII